MNKRIRILCAVILAAAVIFSVSSCGSDVNNGETTETEIFTAENSTTDFTTQYIPVSETATESAVADTSSAVTSSAEVSETGISQTTTVPATAGTATVPSSSTAAVTPTNPPATQPPTAKPTSAPVTQPPQTNYSLDPVTPTVQLSSVPRRQLTDYYIHCTIYSEEEGRHDCEVASDGKTTFFHAAVDNSDVGFILTDSLTGNMYIINYGTREYMSIKSALIKTMGMKTEDLFNDKDMEQLKVFEFSSFGNTIPQKINVGGTDCLKYGYIGDDCYTYYYFRNGENIPFRVDNIKKDGSDGVNITYNVIEKTAGTHLNPPAGFKAISFSLSNMEEAESFMNSMDF